MVPGVFAGRKTCHHRDRWEGALDWASLWAITHQRNDGGTSSGTGHDEQVIGHVELGKKRAPT